MNWRKPEDEEPAAHIYNSPPYTKDRNPVREGRLKKNPFPQKGLSEWREKPVNVSSRTPQPLAESSGITLSPSLRNTQSQHRQLSPESLREDQVMQELNRATNMYLNCPDPTEATARRLRVMAGDKKGQTEELAAKLMMHPGTSTLQYVGTSRLQTAITPPREQIMQELQEVTQQYLSCADPVEAAARRLRVLAGDAEGLMEKTANSILAATEEQRRPLSPWERGIKSVSPPGIDIDEAMQPSDVEVTPPPAPRNSDPHFVDLASPASLTATPTQNGPTRLQSVIVSPVCPQIAEAESVQETDLLADDNETLQSFQRKAKSKDSKLPRMRSPRQTPNILRGASSKKRKLSQIHRSPCNTSKRLNSGPLNSTTASGPERALGRAEEEVSIPTNNPAIRLIPAMNRQRKPNQAPPSDQTTSKQSEGNGGPLKRTSTPSTKYPAATKKKQDFQSGPPPAP